MTQLTYKLKYDFDWFEEIGDVIFWNCGNPIGRVRRKKGTNGTYEI